MPSKSERQRRYLEANFGHEWVHKHGFSHVEGRKKKRSGRKGKRA